MIYEARLLCITKIYHFLAIIYSKFQNWIVTSHYLDKTIVSIPTVLVTVASYCFFVYILQGPGTFDYFSNIGGA